MSFVKNNEYILIYDLSLLAEDEQIKRISNMGINTFVISVPWDEVEVKPNEYDWSIIDKYINLCSYYNSKVIISTPNSTPSWSPDSWYFKNSVGDCNKYSIKPMEPKSTTRRYIRKWDEHYRKFFSIWNLEAQEYTKNFIEKCIQRYSSPNVLLIPHIGTYNEHYFPTMYGLENMKNSLWCFDYNALNDYRSYMENKYDGNLLKYNMEHTNNFKSWDLIFPVDIHSTNTIGWYKTLEWYIDSGHKYSNQMIEYFLDKTSEMWLSVISPIQINVNHMENGIIHRDEYIYEINDYLDKMNKHSEYIFSSVYNCTSDQIYHLFHIKEKIQKNFWVGAESCKNILTNTSNSIKLGFRGVIVNTPRLLIENPNIDEDYRNLEKSFKLWNIYHNKYKNKL